MWQCYNQVGSLLPHQSWNALTTRQPLNDKSRLGKNMVRDSLSNRRLPACPQTRTKGSSNKLTFRETETLAKFHVGRDPTYSGSTEITRKKLPFVTSTLVCNQRKLAKASKERTTSVPRRGSKCLLKPRSILGKRG